MKFIIGLGNPTEKYEHTRHNIGRDILENFRNKNNFEDWEEVKKSNSLTCEGKLGKEKVTLVLPETYMNDSGNALKNLITNKKKAKDTLVIYDDLDLGVGRMKISFNKSSGGHKGLDSVIRKIKTKEFYRLRVGIAPITPKGKVKKVSGEEKVVKHVLSKFKPSEEKTIKKTMKKAVEGIEIFISDGSVKATGEVNSWR